MHEYTVYVLGVSDFASLLMIGHWRWCPRWSSLEMFKKKYVKNINQFDGLVMDLQICIVRFFILFDNNANQNLWGF